MVSIIFHIFNKKEKGLNTSILSGESQLKPRGFSLLSCI